MTVALSPLAGAGWQFFNNNGVPLAGGKIYTYEAGSSTPANAYTTSAGNVAHSNPIVLDAYGRIPNEVWLLTSINYKFVLKDSADVLIGTYDNLYGIASAVDLSNLIANLANNTDPTKGDALIGFRQANASGNLTNAVGKTVHQKLQDFVSVMDFIPSGTNTSTTDCSAYIQNALNSASCVWFPSGTYKITSKIVCNANNYLWSKDAIINSVQTPGSGNAIETADGVVIEGLSFNKGLSDTSRGIAVKGNDVVIRDCSFYKIGYCIHLFTCSNVLIEGNYFYETSYGIINQSANGLVMDGIVISGNIAYNIENDMILFNTNSESFPGLFAKNVTVTGNVCNGVGGITTPKTESRFCGFIHGSNITVTGNAVYGTAGDSAMHFEGQSGGGADVDDTVTITGNTMRDCISAYSRFIWPITQSSGHRHMIISGNVFEVTSATAGVGTSDFIRFIDLVTSGQITITDNIFRYRRDEGDTTTVYGEGLAGAFNPGSIIANNQFINLGNGMYSSQNLAAESIIESNRFTDCNYGISIGNNPNALKIVNNVFNGTVTYDLLLGADIGSAAVIYGNRFTSAAKSINNKLYVDLMSCYNNKNAGFGKNQLIANVNKATDYAIGSIGGGSNNILISSLSEYKLNAVNFWADLTSILGRGGNYSALSLNSKQGSVLVTGVTYTITADVLYIQCAAGGAVGAGEINFEINIY